MAIDFFTVSSSKPVVAKLTLSISRHLAENKSVLWLVSGGSAIRIAVEAAQMLERSNIHNISKLTISLADERYGHAGHKDSNWQQLKDAGLSLDGANLQPILKGQDLQQTTKDYALATGKNLRYSDYKIALVGIGADGHTLGIKPHSPAVNSGAQVSAYTWEDWTRITLTPKAIGQLDEIVAYVMGQEKHRTLDDLGKSVSAEKQPAQYLKKAGKLTVYNDYKGKEL